MTLTQKLVSSAVVAMVALLALPTIVSAQVQGGAPAPLVDEVSLGLEYGAKTGLGGGDLRDTAAGIINVALGLLGIIAVVIILIGGFQWMTSGGSTEGAEKGKSTITAGIIGLVIILSAYAIARFVLGSLATATTSAGF